MRIDLHIPQTWNELTRDQLLFVSLLFLSGCTEKEFKLRAMMYLAGLRSNGNIQEMDVLHSFRKDKKDFTIDTITLKDLTDRVQWILDDITLFEPLKRIKWVKPPNKKMYGVTLRQYITAENFFYAYKQTGKTYHLNCLVASIYKLPWKRFSDRKVTRRAKYFRHVSKEVKYTVFLYFAGLQRFLSKEYPKLYQSGSSGKVDMKKQLNTILRTLTHGDVTRRDQVLNTELHDALSELNSTIEENEEYKKQLKKKK